MYVIVHMLYICCVFIVYIIINYVNRFEARLLFSTSHLITNIKHFSKFADMYRDSMSPVRIDQQTHLKPEAGMHYA